MARNASSSIGQDDDTINKLLDLQVTLDYSNEVVEHYKYFGVSEVAISAFLLRFLLSVDSPAAAAKKLSSRRIFEHSLPSLSITPGIVAALRSGAFRILGRDTKGRVVLFFNVARASAPNLEADEIPRLLILLLEYMQSLAVAEAPRTPTNSYKQQFVLLVNEEECHWATQQAMVSKANSIHSIFEKYYPGLVGLVVVVGASFETREGIHSSLLSFPSSVKDNVYFVQRSSVPQYMPSDVIPSELGGRLQPESDGMYFSEVVLRQWYTLTAFLQEEASTPDKKGARPTYILPPISVAHSTPAKKLVLTLATHHRMFSPYSRENSTHTYELDDDDDGLCSLVTDVDETDERTEMILREEGDDVKSTMALNPLQLLRAYRMECALRKAAEQRLQHMNQPLRLDPRHASTVEKTLIAVHRDVNTMMFDILTRAKASGPNDVPSLAQLLETTIAALEKAGSTASPPPVMATAGPPAQEEEKADAGGCCCCS